MPFTTTFATLSARGFGLFGKKKVLTTVTFPSGTTTWTAPASVGTLVSVVGKGGDGAAGYYYGASYYYVWNNIVSFGGPFANPPPAPTVSDSCGPAIVSYINGLSGLQNISGTSFFPVIQIQTHIPDNTWRYNVYSTTYPGDWQGGGWVVGGTASLSIINPYAAGVEYQSYSFPYNGADTTAFGLTFPGGVEAPAPTITYNNVTITPGATYTIVNNGSLTITYYV